MGKTKPIVKNKELQAALRTPQQRLNDVASYNQKVKEAKDARTKARKEREDGE